MRPRAWLLLLLLLPLAALLAGDATLPQPVAGLEPTATIAWPTRITPVWGPWPVVPSVTPWPARTRIPWTPPPTIYVVIEAATETPWPWLVARPSPEASELATLWAGHAEVEP